MKKKILLLPTYFPTPKAPIVGSQVQEQAELLSGDFEFVVLYCLPGISRRRHYWNSLTALLTGKKKYLPCTPDLLPGKLNVRGVYYFQSRCNSFSRNQRLKIKAYRHLLDELIKEGWKPDLLHARGHESAGPVAAALKESYRIPYLLTENVAFVFDQTFSQHKLDNYLYAINQADAILYVSTYLMRLTLLHGIGLKSRHIVVGNRINEQVFDILPSGKDKDFFRIFFTGYNSYIKDFDTFFKAIRFLTGIGHRNLKVLVGVTYYWSEANKNELIELAESLEIRDYCEFVYAIPREEMPAYYNRCDVYVSTSLTETFGIAAAEAMFCGVPVVSTANGGIDDFIDDSNGIKVPLRDYRAVAEAILTIKRQDRVFNPGTVRASVLGRFGSKGFSQRMSEAYLSAL